MPTLTSTFNNQQLTIKRKVKGFTLIELLIVIAILGILATFIVANFGSAQARGRDAKRKADLDAIKKALVLFKNDTLGGAFHPSEIYPPGGALSTLNYIRVMPNDPQGGQYQYFAGGTGCIAGSILINSRCPDYRLRINLENSSDPNAPQSQLSCPSAGFTPLNPMPAYDPIRTYVVCP